MRGVRRIAPAPRRDAAARAYVRGPAMRAGRRHWRVVSGSAVPVVCRIGGPGPARVAEPDAAGFARARDGAPSADQPASGKGVEIHTGAPRDATRPLI